MQNRHNDLYHRKVHARFLVPLLAVTLTMIGCAVEDADEASVPPPAKETTGAELVVPPLLAWSFEPASADCNGWKVKGAVAIRAVPARTGNYSCKLCADGSAEAITLTRDLGPVSAGRYELSAWVRSRVQNPAPHSASATLEAGNAVATTPVVSIRGEWDSIATTLDLATDSDHVRVSIGSPSVAENECLFIDDVRVEKAP